MVRSKAPCAVMCMPDDIGVEKIMKESQFET